MVINSLYAVAKNNADIKEQQQNLADAIVWIKSLKNNEKIALELELTAKSEKRYRELILKYRLSKDFNKVLYVTNQRQIETKIKSLLGTGLVNEKFKFLTLTDVFNPRPNLTINNLFELKAQEGGPT